MGCVSDLLALPLPDVSPLARDRAGGTSPALRNAAMHVGAVGSGKISDRLIEHAGVKLGVRRSAQEAPLVAILAGCTYAHDESDSGITTLRLR